MRKVLPLLLLVLPLACDGPTGRCGELGDDLIEAGEELDRDPSLENFNEASRANDAWRAAGCDE
jgi:hypothetical protein